MMSRRTHSRSLRVIGIAVLALSLGGCFSSDSGTGPNGGQAADTVVIRLTANNTFDPSSVTIAPGTMVRWVNDAAIFHTVTPENPNQAGVWQTATTNAVGLVRQHVFTAAGQTYRYRCEPHSPDFTSGMVGVITVSQ